MKDIYITTANELEKVLNESIANIDSLKDANVIIDPKLLNIHIIFKGDRFDSSLPSSAMAGLLEIQKLVYDIYSKTKPEGKKLTQEEKKKLELNIKVGKGSTDINIDITEVLKNMTGEQILIGLGVISFAYIIVQLGKEIINNRSKVKLAEIEERKLKEEEETKRNLYQKFENMFLSVVEFKESVQRKLIKANPDSIVINNETLTPLQIEQANPPAKRVRYEETDKVFTGLFRIIRIDIDENDGTFIDVIHIESKRKIERVNILADFISKDDYQWLKDAVEDGKGKPISMSIVARMKNDQILHSYIMSFNKQNQNNVS